MRRQAEELAAKAEAERQRKLQEMEKEARRKGRAFGSQRLETLAPPPQPAGGGNRSDRKAFFAVLRSQVESTPDDDGAASVASEAQSQQQQQRQPAPLGGRRASSRLAPGKNKDKAGAEEPKLPENPHAVAKRMIEALSKPKSMQAADLAGENEADVRRAKALLTKSNLLDLVEEEEDKMMSSSKEEILQAINTMEKKGEGRGAEGVFG